MLILLNLDAPRIDILGVVDTWERYFSSHGITEDVGESDFYVDQSLSALELACLGAGFVLPAKSFALPYLQDGRLKRANKEYIKTDHSHYLVYRDVESSQSPTVRVFRDWLMEEFKESD